MNSDGTISGKKLASLLPKAKKDSEKSPKYLRLCLILLAVAIGLAILGIFLPFLWVLSGLAGLAALIFFILWLLSASGSI